MSPSLGQSSLEPGRWGWGQVGEAGASLLGGACWGTVPRLRPHGWRCQGRGGMGAQLPCSPACVHTLTLSLLAVTLLMDTVGPRGAEEVHRSLGALGGGWSLKMTHHASPALLGLSLQGPRGLEKGPRHPQWLARVSRSIFLLMCGGITLAQSNAISNAERVGFSPGSFSECSLLVSRFQRSC